MRTRLENDLLVVEADTAGGELASIRSKADGTEYLWQADERYWKRHAPVLFPVVGSLKDRKLSIDGKVYPMGQHGFARDMEFTLKSKSDDSVWFELASTTGTLAKYPYVFKLEIGYILQKSAVKTIWRVTNTGSGDMHYQIGGHPAFNCPLGNGSQTDCFIRFDSDKPISYRLLNKDGLLEDRLYELATDNGFFRITADLFDRDALIIEGSQSGCVSLCRNDRTPYLTVAFDSPLYGLWSPAGKGAPFVCIEPWFGRADRAGFDGDISEREYDQTLGAGENREYSYTISVC